LDAFDEVERLYKKKHEINNRLAVLRAQAQLKGESMPPEQEMHELNVTKEGLSLKSTELNTIATVVTLALVLVIAYVGYQHDAKSSERDGAFISAIKEQTGAIKEQTQVAREQNCLMRFDQKERTERAEFCKSITR
jgi:hypothetical protein